MREAKYKIPSPHTMVTKSSQISSLTHCRDISRIYFSKIKETGQHIREMMDQEKNSSFSHKFFESQEINQLVYDTDNNLEESEVKKSSLEKLPDVVSSHHYHSEETLDMQKSHNFRQKSRTEETFSQSLKEQLRNELIPNDFRQVFHTENGIQYPCHPKHTNRWSKFPVGFHGCFTCCKSVVCADRECFKDNPQSSSNFHFEMNCHHPETWFKYLAKK